MKTILVPTDFSPSAHNAAEYAVSLAEKIKAKVLLLHVYPKPVFVSTSMNNTALDAVDVRKEKERFLKNEMDHLKKNSYAEIICMTKTGVPADEITKIENHADLIIMGMKGAGRLSEILIGSITTKILRKSKIPVIAIPEKARYKDPERIVFACDYDPRTDIRSLDGLKGFMKAFAPKIFVLNIKQKKETVTAEKMKSVKFEDGTDTVEHVYYFPGKKDLANGINEFAEEYNADMVVIIPHRYEFLEELFHKSTSKKLAFLTDIPLLGLPDDHTIVPAYFL